MTSAPLTEATDPHCLRGEERGDLLTGHPWRRLVVMGDSIAAGVGDPVAGYADVSWSDRLAHALGAAGGPASYRNLGVRGLLAHEIRATQLDTARGDDPDLVVVTGGGNDAVRRRFDPAAVEADLDALVGTLRRDGADVVTFGLFDLSRSGLVPEPLRDGLRARLVAVNEATRRVTERWDGIHVDFFDHPQDDGIWSADRLHPNRRGHAMIEATTVRALGAALRRRPRPIVGAVPA